MAVDGECGAADTLVCSAVRGRACGASAGSGVRALRGNPPPSLFSRKRILRYCIVYTDTDTDTVHPRLWAPLVCRLSSSVNQCGKAKGARLLIARANHKLPRANVAHESNINTRRGCHAHETRKRPNWTQGARKYIVHSSGFRVAPKAHAQPQVNKPNQNAEDYHRGQMDTQSNAKSSEQMY